MKKLLILFVASILCAGAVCAIGTEAPVYGVAEATTSGLPSSVLGFYKGESSGWVRVASDLVNVNGTRYSYQVVSTSNNSYSISFNNGESITIFRDNRLYYDDQWYNMTVRGDN